MSPILEPSPAAGRTIAGTFAVLASWYASHRSVRRLWAFREAQALRVLVTLEPTRDGDDISPVWLANGGAWAHDLQLRLGSPVQLEATDEPMPARSIGDIDGMLVAELHWRDASMPCDDVFAVRAPAACAA